MKAITTIEEIDDMIEIGMRIKVSLQKYFSSHIGIFLLCVPLLFWSAVIPVINKARHIFSNSREKSFSHQLVSTTKDSQLKIKNVLLKEKKTKEAEFSFQYTSAIGTVSHPTLDGGIINGAEGITVNSPSNEILTPKTQPNLTPSNPDFRESRNDLENAFAADGKVEKFSDKWAKSTGLERILLRAVQSGQLGYVLSETRNHRLPASVALVPIVESAYRNEAVSPKGAVGSWQLMAETAIENGIDPVMRTEFAPSTQAAIRFLNQLYRHFGNWELTFAAYNAGSATVDKAIKKNPHAISLQELDLPQETKNYVNELMSLTRILSNTKFANTTINEKGIN